MIVLTDYVVRIAILELKDDTELSINTDTVLPRPVAFQGFKPVSWWATKVTQNMSRI